jgi:hypothetical protein
MKWLTRTAGCTQVGLFSCWSPSVKDTSHQTVHRRPAGIYLHRALYLEHSPKTSPRGCFVWHLQAASPNLPIWLGLRWFFYLWTCSFCVSVCLCDFYRAATEQSAWSSLRNTCSVLYKFNLIGLD